MFGPILGPIIWYGLLTGFVILFGAWLALLGLVVVGYCLDLRDRWRTRPGLRWMRWVVRCRRCFIPARCGPGGPYGAR